MLGEDAGPVRYRHERHGFSLEIPDGWKAQTLSGPLAFIARDGEADGFATNMNVSIASTADDLETYVDLEHERAADYLTDLALVEREPVTVDGRPTIRCLCRYRQGRFSIALEQWVVQDGPRYVTISAAAEEDHWNDVRPDLRTIVESLTFG